MAAPTRPRNSNPLTAHVSLSPSAHGLSRIERPRFYKFQLPAEYFPTVNGGIMAVAWANALIFDVTLVLLNSNVRYASLADTTAGSAMSALLLKADIQATGQHVR